VRKLQDRTDAAAEQTAEQPAGNDEQAAHLDEAVPEQPAQPAAGNGQVHKVSQVSHIDDRA